MFVTADRLFRHVRAVGRDERGASLVVVVALMAMGFIVALVIAAAALFSLRQNVAAKSSVQSFAAAEAGRDAVVAALEIAPESCPVTAQYTSDPDSDDPQFTVTVHPSNLENEPANADHIAQDCPANGDRWVVLRSTGTAPDGGSTMIDAVYPWERFRIQVAGGGLGYMDTTLSSTLFSNTSGDTVIKKGDFNCSIGTTFDGNVFVLNGNVGVGSLGSCTVTGDLYASGTISVSRGCILFFCSSGTLNVGGQVKSIGGINAQGRLRSGTNASAPFRDIASQGNVVTSHSDGDIEALNGGRVLSEQNITSNTGPIRAAGDIIANQTITAGGEIRSRGGSVRAHDITGGNTVLAQLSIQAGNNIEGNGRREADGGDITAVGNISGSGVRVASRSVLAGGDINAGGAVTAEGGDIHAGGVISGGMRTASGSVLGKDGISASASTANGGNIRTNGSITGSAIASGDIWAATGISSTANIEVRANNGGILSGGDIVLTGQTSKLIAGPNATTPRGSIAASGRIESSGQTTAEDVLALFAIKVDRACQISRDVHAGTTLNFDDVVSGQRANWNSPTCAVGRNFFAGSSSAASALGVSSGSGNSRTFPNTRLSLQTSGGITGAIRVPAGWAPAANNKYMTAAGAVGTAAGGGANPGSPTIGPAPEEVVEPTVEAPDAFRLVLNEDPNGTWETFADLQLRTTWVDLGRWPGVPDGYTTWPGYTQVGPLTGTRCGNSWFGSAGHVRTILQTPGAVTVDGFDIPADVPVVIDATQCSSLSMTSTWGSDTVLRRDAVLLVNNVNLTFASFTASQPRQLAIVQVDKDNGEEVPTWNPGGDREPVPHCSTGQDRISMTLSRSGWDTDVHMLLYSPCGINGSFASSWRGHLYTHNDNVQSGVLTTLICEPMEVVGVVDLPCNINDVAQFGSMNTNAWRLGQRLSQTEP